MQMFRRCEKCDDGIPDFNDFRVCNCGATYCEHCGPESICIRPSEFDVRERYITCIICEEV